jgi:PII-like signaling protein
MHPYRSYEGICLRLFFGEAEEWQGKPLYQVLIERARQYGIKGATILRATEGFGPEHHLSTERLVDLSDNLPLIIEMVDSQEQIETLLPELDQVMQRGMITMTPVTIIEGKEK